MAKKKVYHCQICLQAGVTKATHCDLHCKNNANNCHHSKAKGMCLFENTNNKINKYLIKKDKCIFLSNERKLILPRYNKSSYWSWLFKVACNNSFKLVQFDNNG